jgi:DNA-binding NtrC family response regulator
MSAEQIFDTSHSYAPKMQMQAGGTAMTPAILVVDDDIYTQQLFKGLLRSIAREVEIVGTLSEARAAFRSRDFNLVILDQRLPDGNGLDFFAEIRGERPRQMVILITGYAEIQDAVRAVREGLFDYRTKPFDNLDELETVIVKALEMDRAYREIQDLRTLFGEASEQPIIGNSPKIEQLLTQIRNAAPLNTTILIEGESGTGKEVFAKLVHALSGRAKAPLLAVNCGALHESLLEAALFGYEKGAFTGAAKTTGGYFEQADGATLFLDEITDMSPKLQASLLRVLQEFSFTRLGSTTPRTTDFRLICATNKSLEAEVKAGRFRSDLYFRINVVSLHVPALREHPDDILPLALYFLSHFNQKFNKSTGPFTPSAIAAMSNANWPGNIRELKHAIERAVAINPGGPIGPGDLGLAASQNNVSIGAAAAQTFREARDDFERAYFSDLLKRAGGSVTEAARVSGIARQNIYGHINRLGLDASNLPDDLERKT